MANINKTNAARLLDRLKIPYRLVPYTVDENHLEAAHVAEELNEDINRVFKTLVLRGEKTGCFVCVVPGNMEVDLKKAAKAIGTKKAEMLHMKELLSTTGYIRGGCSPLGMKKHFPTLIHTSANDFPTIFVSAGVRGLQIETEPAALARAAEARFADIAKSPEQQ